MAVGCDLIFGPNERREVGIIQGLSAESPEIEIPETVQAGEDFTVTIRTGWHNGCARMDTVEVTEEGPAAVTLTPYDIITNGGHCTQQTQTFVHTATLRFSEPGTAQVTIRGRSSGNSGVISVQRAVTVE